MLAKVGVSISDAITMFLTQVVLADGLPFDVRVPKQESRTAISELHAGRGTRFAGSTKELFDHLGKKRKKRAE